MNDLTNQQKGCSKLPGYQAGYNAGKKSPRHLTTDEKEAIAKEWLEDRRRQILRQLEITNQKIALLDASISLIERGFILPISIQEELSGKGRSAANT